MDLVQTSQLQRPRARLFPAVAILLTLAVFAGTLGIVNLRLRSELRDQISGRDAQVLYGVALLQGLTEKSGADLDADADLMSDEATTEVSAILQAEQLKEVVATLKGIVGARLFDAKAGLITSLPAALTDATLPGPDFAALVQLRPVSHYHPAARREDLFIDAAANAPEQPEVRPLLEVLIPLRGGLEGRLIGVAQLLLDGSSIAAEYTALDRHLVRQAGGVFLGGGAMLGFGLAWAFRRLQRANRLLAERTSSLLQANAELALAAKTTAVGAVTAHLIHALKNPLSGLQSFVNNRGSGQTPDPEADWAEAVGTTRRMQGLIQEVVRVLREEGAVSQYEISPAELLDLVVAKARPIARDAGVELEAGGTAAGVLTNRSANLVMLILENLITNAIQATPRAKVVGLRLGTASDRIQFEVSDQGPGFPTDMTPFSPARSNKPGGSGIGLAISKQLANHLGGELELRSSTPAGCSFVLTLQREQGQA